MEIISRKEAKERGLGKYFTGKPCKHGHVSERSTLSGGCLECQSYWNKENKNRSRKVKVNINWYKGLSYDVARKYKLKCFDVTEDSRQFKSSPCKLCGSEIKLTIRKRCAKCSKVVESDFVIMTKKERDVELTGRYSIRHQDKVKASRKLRSIKNKDAILCRNLISRVKTNWKGGRKDAEDILGWSWSDLSERMSEMFRDGMIWDNHGEWHIDHIKPIKAFLDEGITDPKIINALDNLQPLWAHENLSKGAKYDG